MKNGTTRERILEAAVKLFAKEGYADVSVGQIAAAVGIKAPSIYKHYKSKRDIFEQILRVMERRDRENAAASSVPEDSAAVMPQAYAQTTMAELIAYSRRQFRYWTEDDFASSFRKLLNVEQYRSAETSALYHRYLGAGPLRYVADLLGSETEALSFYGPMYLLYSVYDCAEDKAAVYAMLDAHLERWKKR